MSRQPTPHSKALAFVLVSALLCALVMAVTPTAFAATTIYVATTGNDSNDCLSEATACLTIQAAIDKAAAGDTVSVAAGTYDTTATTVIDEALTLTGPTGGGAILQGTNSAVIPVLDISASNVTIQNLEVTHNALPAWPNPDGSTDFDYSLVRILPNLDLTVTITDSKIHVPQQVGAMTTWNGIAIFVSASVSSGNNVTITNNEIYNTRNGVVIRNNNDVTLTGNTIYNTKGGIMNYTSNPGEVARRSMSGNAWGTVHNEWDIVWNGGGSYLPADRVPDVLGVSTDNNGAYVLDQRCDGTCTSATVTSNRSHAFVNATTGTTTKHGANGNINLPYQTIALGVEAVVAGGTVNVAAGTYAENVIVDKHLLLQGAGNETVIDPASGHGITIKTAASGLNATTRTVIRDLRVTGAAQGVRFDSNATIQFVTLANLTANYNTEPGIQLREASTYEDIRIEDCVSEYNYAGVDVRKTNVHINGLTLSGGSFSHNTNSGFISQSLDVTNVTIENATFADNAVDAAWNTGVGNLTLFSFNGNLTLSNTTIDATAADFGVMINMGELPYGSSLGNVSLSNVQIIGAVENHGLQIGGGYSDVSNLSFNDVTFNVDLQAGLSGSGARRAALYLGSLSGPTGIDLGNTTFSGARGTGSQRAFDLYHARPLPVDATDATFTGAADGFAIEDRVYHGLDNAASGLVRWTANNVYVTPDSGSIQRGVAAATAGDTVNVAAGTYVDEIVIDKALTLVGPNAAVNPNTGTRGPEALILPVRSEPDPDTSGCEVMVEVQKSNVTIKGFTLDGDNPNLTSGIMIDGADVDACELVAGWEGVGNIVVENNILKHATYAGVEFYNWTNQAPTAGNYIRYNLIEDIGETTYNWGIGVLVYNNFYADITDNVMAGVRTGVQTGNFWQANPGTTGSISNNQIGVWRLGIFHNLQYSAASPLTVSGNTITAETYPGANKWNGMLISSIQNAVNATITNNTITIPPAVTFTAPGYAAGYNVWNVTTTAPITINGGTVTGGDYGVFVNNYEGYTSNANNTAIKVDGVTVLGSKVAGVYVKDSPDNTNSATVYANIQNSTIDTDATGILVEGADATAKANLNNLAGNPTKGLTNTNPSATVDAEYNWWGSACPAAVVSGNVDFDPWWLDETGSATATATNLVIPAGATTAEQQAVLGCAAPGSTITYLGDPAAGGVVVDVDGVTINLGGFTVGHGTPAFTINSDNVSIVGPGALDGNWDTYPAVLVNGGADNFTLKDVEVREWEDGVQVAGAVESLKIVGNWFHNNTDAGLQVDAAVDGVVTIEGNLFKENTGPGIRSAVALEAQYNSWGHIDGAASGDVVGPVDVTNPTYVEYWIDIDPNNNPAELRLAEGAAFSVALKADARLLNGLTFQITYPAELTMTGAPTFVYPWAGVCAPVTSPVPPADSVAYRCTIINTPLEWNGGTIATFPFQVEALTGSPLNRWFDIAHAAPATSAAAIGGVKVYVNNAGFGAPSVPGRDITDAQDSGKLILGKLAQYKGFIDLQGRSNDSLATLVVKNQQVKSGSVSLASGTSAAGGGYTTALLGPTQLFQGETYWFQVDRALYLPTTALASYSSSPIPADWQHSKLLGSSALQSLATVVLLGGDATNDDVIDTGDAGCIGGRYGQAPAVCGTGGTGGTGGTSDVNDDGRMDILDLTLMGGNYGKTASPAPAIWVP